MYSVELMNKEHEHIKDMLAVLRAASLTFMNDNQFDANDFAMMIHFVRAYADKHHHGKEELLFFNHMVEHLGPAAEKLVTHGMLVEHDLGRLYISTLEEGITRYQNGDSDAKLDIIASAISYTHLLARHIAKEDDVVFPFAERFFSEDIKQKINSQFEDYEKEKEAEGVQDTFLSQLNQLKAKYLIFEKPRF